MSSDDVRHPLNLCLATGHCLIQQHVCIKQQFHRGHLRQLMSAYFCAQGNQVRLGRLEYRPQACQVRRCNRYTTSHETLVSCGNDRALAF